MFLLITLLNLFYSCYGFSCLHLGSLHPRIFVLDVVENLQKEDVLIERQEEGKNFLKVHVYIWVTVQSTFIFLGRVNKPKPTKQEEHMADVTSAMLYLACGG